MKQSRQDRGLLEGGLQFGPSAGTVSVPAFYGSGQFINSLMSDL